jgi:hypothetical protein
MKKNYEESCNAYLRLFCKKHGFDYDDEAWVADDVGGIANVADYFVCMETIRTDIDMDMPEDEFIKYQDYCIRAAMLGANVPSYRAWVKGCPRKSNAEFEKLERLRAKIIILKHSFKKQIDEYVDWTKGL